MEPETYRFSRMSHSKKVYLISMRQKKTIPPHGKKFHSSGKKRLGKSEFWWYLLPGAYYLYTFNKVDRQWKIQKLHIIKASTETIEEIRDIDYVPKWLKNAYHRTP